MAFKVPGEFAGVYWLGSFDVLRLGVPREVRGPMGEAVLPLFGGRIWLYWALLQPDLLLALWPGPDSPGGDFCFGQS